MFWWHEEKIQEGHLKIKEFIEKNDFQMANNMANMISVKLNQDILPFAQKITLLNEELVRISKPISRMQKQFEKQGNVDGVLKIETLEHVDALIEHAKDVDVMIGNIVKTLTPVAEKKNWWKRMFG